MSTIKFCTDILYLYYKGLLLSFIYYLLLNQYIHIYFFSHRVLLVVQTVCLSKNLAQWYHNLCIILKIMLLQSLCDILPFLKKEQIYVICICMVLYFYTASKCEFSVAMFILFISVNYHYYFICYCSTFVFFVTIRLSL